MFVLCNFSNARTGNVKTIIRSVCIDFWKYLIKLSDFEQFRKFVTSDVLENRPSRMLLLESFSEFDSSHYDMVLELCSYSQSENKKVVGTKM